MTHFCYECQSFHTAHEGCWYKRIDALKAKLAEMEQERDALRGALHGIQTMGIPFFWNGESDYQRAFSTCVREAGKALEEFYKTRPPSSGETEPYEPASTSPASEVVGSPAHAGMHPMIAVPADGLSAVYEENKMLREELSALRERHRDYSTGIAEAIGHDRLKRDTGEPARSDRAEIEELKRECNRLKTRVGDLKFALGTDATGWSEKSKRER